jgi:hypothetical protein
MDDSDGGQADGNSVQYRRAAAARIVETTSVGTGRLVNARTLRRSEIVASTVEVDRGNSRHD